MADCRIVVIVAFRWGFRIGVRFSTASLLHPGHLPGHVGTVRTRSGVAGELGVNRVLLDRVLGGRTDGEGAR